MFIFLFFLSNKLSTKLNTFFAYKLDDEIGNLFKILLYPIILMPFFSIILLTSVKAVFQPWIADKSYITEPGCRLIIMLSWIINGAYFNGHTAVQITISICFKFSVSMCSC